MTEYEPIKTSFKRYGDQCNLVERKGDVALFERKSPSGRIHHEIVIIRRIEAGERFGKPFPSQEVYPSCAQWGTYGWTSIGGLEAAKERMELEYKKRQPVKAVRKRSRR